MILEDDTALSKCFVGYTVSAVDEWVWRSDCFVVPSSLNHLSHEGHLRMSEQDGNKSLMARDRQAKEVFINCVSCASSEKSLKIYCTLLSPVNYPFFLWEELALDIMEHLTIDWQDIFDLSSWWLTLILNGLKLHLLKIHHGNRNPCI